MPRLPRGIIGLSQYGAMEKLMGCGCMENKAGPPFTWATIIDTLRSPMGHSISFQQLFGMTLWDFLEIWYC